MWKVRLFHPNALLYEDGYNAVVPELRCLLNDVLCHVDLSVSGCAILPTNSAAKIHGKSVFHIFFCRKILENELDVLMMASVARTYMTAFGATWSFLGIEDITSRYISNHCPAEDCRKH